MFSITDGRECFYQWDLNRSISVNDPDIAEVHFCNRTDDCSLVVEVDEVAADTLDGQHFSYRTANVPNILLQNDYPIRVYAYCGDGYTKIEKVFKVISRTKPADYVYTETEIKSWDKLEADISASIEELNAATKQIGDIDAALDALHEYAESYLTEIYSGDDEE